MHLKIFKAHLALKPLGLFWETTKKLLMRMISAILSKLTKLISSSLKRTLKDLEARIWIMSAFRFFIHGLMSLIQLILNTLLTIVYLKKSAKSWLIAWMRQYSGLAFSNLKKHVQQMNFLKHWDNVVRSIRSKNISKLMKVILTLSCWNLIMLSAWMKIKMRSLKLLPNLLMRLWLKMDIALWSISLDFTKHNLKELAMPIKILLVYLISMTQIQEWNISKQILF